MQTMIFDIDLAGHHMEYLHHIYAGALRNKEEKYIFYLPLEFQDKKRLYEWESSDNVEFRYFSQQEIHTCTCSNIYLNAWRTSILLKKKVAETKCDRVLLISFVELMLFIVLLLPSKVRVSGIIYRIYLYDWQKMGLLRRLLEWVRYKSAVGSKCIERLLVLNDSCSVNMLNEIYSTDKFRLLADPVPNVDFSRLKNLREELNIPANDKIYLHFGGLSRRKGTLDILNAIAISNIEEMQSRTFVIAGKVYDEIKPDFQSLLIQARRNTNVLVFDRFCTYEYLYDLCFTADVILIPYHLTNLSSGLLGYASLFHKPVIGPSEGLIGQLIRSFGLGITISHICSEELLKAINYDYYPTVDSSYAENNTTDKFINTLLDVENKHNTD